MNSMTGYGRGSATDDGMDLVVEITSVNRRNLETHVSMPKEWQSLDRMICAEVGTVIKRGRVQVSIQCQDVDSPNGFVWDREGAASLLRSLAEFAREAEIPFEPNMVLLGKLAMLHRKNSKLWEAEAAMPLVQTALGEALEELLAMRLQEGASLLADLAERHEALEKILDDIREKSSGEVSRYRKNLFKRLRQAGLELDLDDERVLREIALFADRCDISEELVRLGSHLQQFSEILTQEDSIGRKLEFLLQEILRECNTIGSKSIAVEISKNVLKAKNEIERIREQLQNVQ